MTTTRSNDWSGRQVRTRAVLARDNKRGYLPCAPDEVPMVLLEAPGTVVAGAHGCPLVPVSMDLAMSALETVVGTASAAGSTGTAPRLERLSTS